MTNTYTKIKTLTDPILAILVTLLIWPILVLICILIRLDSPGFALFKQMRVGKNQKLFPIYKFRTMHQDAQKQQKDLEHLNMSSPPTFKIINDPRVTRIGKFLRQTNIDELPQLINIIRGQMHFIGYRPPLPSEVKKYTSEQLQRFNDYPGITSLWAVHGMHNLTFQQWIDLDLEYSSKKNLILDVSITLKTAKLVIKKTIQYLSKKIIKK